MPLYQELLFYSLSWNRADNQPVKELDSPRVLYLLVISIRWINWATSIIFVPIFLQLSDTVFNANPSIPHHTCNQNSMVYVVSSIKHRKAMSLKESEKI
jgi:hypothetical protein